MDPIIRPVIRINDVSVEEVTQYKLKLLSDPQLAGNTGLLDIIDASMFLQHWSDMEFFSRNLLNQLTNDEEHKLFKSFCYFYIGCSLSNQRDHLNAIKNYDQSIQHIINPEQNRDILARVNNFSAYSFYQLAKQKDGEITRVLLFKARNQFLVAANLFSVENNFEEWKLSVQNMITCSKVFDSIDKNDISFEDMIRFLVLQIKRTDVSCSNSISGNSARIFLMNTLAELGKKIFIEKLISDSRFVYEKMQSLRMKIEKSDPQSLDCKILQGNLAIYHIKVGENIDAIFIFSQIMTGLNWRTHPKFYSDCQAFLGKSWFDLGELEKSIDLLKRAMCRVNTEDSQEQFWRIREMYVRVEKKMENLRFNGQKKSTGMISLDQL
jgi:tetratricopeptide (TPR) repeat protein